MAGRGPQLSRSVWYTDLTGLTDLALETGGFQISHHFQADRLINLNLHTNWITISAAGWIRNLVRLRIAENPKHCCTE